VFFSAVGGGGSRVGKKILRRRDRPSEGLFLRWMKIRGEEEEKSSYRRLQKKRWGWGVGGGGGGGGGAIPKRAF